MEKSTKKWLIGCGIGCGAVVVILVLLLVLGFFFMRDMVNKFEETGEWTASLNNLYGEIEDFVPSSDGRISPGRMEAFLFVRERMRPVRDKLETSISILDNMRERGDKQDSRRPGRIFHAFRAAFGLIPAIGDFYTQRSKALLECEMGLGEYAYIYILSYYSMLEKPPGDGPGFQLVQAGAEWRFDQWDREDSFEDRNIEMTRRINQLILQMLKNQVSQLETLSSSAGEEWQGVFLAEIQALEADALRIPWRGNPPEVIESSLRPYLARLDSTYSSLTNILELAQE